MCYASPVMLRGRCSCAISDRPVSASGTQTPRPTPSSAPRLLVTSHSFTQSDPCEGPLATALVSPLFPLHPRNRPVTPLFPLLKQKQGGGRYLMRELSATSAQRSGGETKADPSRKMIFAAEFLCHSSSGDFNRLEQARTASEGGPYTNVELSTLNFEPLFSPNSSHSRTSETFARKSNYSRTYAKTGGGGR
jgi:hypothetical protein